MHCPERTFFGFMSKLNYIVLIPRCQRDQQLGMGEAYDQFMACGGDWLKSDLVMESKDSKETTKFGRWKTMSRLVTHLKLLV